MNNFYGFLTKKGKNIFLITLLSSALLFASCINDLFNDDKSSKKQQTQTEQTEQTGSEELIPVKINISNKKQIENILQNVKPQKNISQARAASPQNVTLAYKILYKKVTDASQSSTVNQDNKEYMDELTDSSPVLQLSKGNWDFTLIAYYNDTSDKEMVVFSGDLLKQEITPGNNNSLEFTLKEPDSGKGNISITLKLPALTDYATVVKAQLKNSSLVAIDGYDEPESTINSGNPFVYSLNNVPHGNYFAVFTITTKNLTAASDENSTETTVYPVPVRVVTNLSSESEETLDEIRNVCVITYALGTDGTVSWKDGTTPERVYKKYQNVTLPTYEKLAPIDTKIFNGWKVQGSTDSESKLTMIIEQNVTLEPDWITTTLYVDGSSTSTNPDAVKTLQDAVNKLVTYEALDGDSYQHEWTISVNGKCSGTSWLRDEELKPLQIIKLTITGDDNTQDILNGSTVTGPVITFDSDNYPLYIENLTIQNGSHTAGGGLNITNTTAYLNNVVLIDNTATDNGGAIALTQSKLFIYGGTKIGSDAATDAATDTACSNRAGKNGGGIYADENSTIYFGYTAVDEPEETLPTNSITYNYAGSTVTNGGGGGIYCLGKLYTNGGTISYNSAAYGGGINTFHLSMKGSNVSNNSATATFADGGGIFIQGTSQTVSVITSAEYNGNNYLTTISNNSSKMTGGGISFSDGKLYISGTSISSNKATSFGGGIYVPANSSARLFLYGTTTIGADEASTPATSESYSNSATCGGGIYISANSSAYINYSSEDDPEHSGDVKINYNYASSSANNEGGGGIYAERNSKLYIAKGTTINYNAGYKGGGIYAKESTTYMSGGTIYGNNASLSGGGIYLAGLKIDDVTYYGTLYMYDEAKIGTSENPNSAQYGGGIYLADSYSQAYLGYSGIDGENKLITKELSGGVSYNKAFDPDYDSFGGGIYNKGLLQVYSGSISNNISKSDGGGVYNKGDFQFYSGKIESNEAGNNGGGVYNPSDMKFTMTGGTIASNSAVNGGGVYNKKGAQFSMTVGTIASNSAVDGGGVYNEGIFHVSKGNIKSNTASGDGGGIYTASATLTDETVLEDSEITENKAVNGGGVYISSDTLHIKGDTIFKENTATDKGGAIGGQNEYSINIEDQGESAYAYIEPNPNCNDIYLNSSSSINLNSDTLSPDHYYIARFTPKEYVDNRAFIYAGDLYNKFLVTPETVTDTTGLTKQVLWETRDDGHITTDNTTFVKIQGDTITGPVGDSGVFITDRSLTLQSYYICDHEVTQGEYEKYCTYGEAPDDWNGWEVDNAKVIKDDNYPACFVSWYDALVYCNLRSIAEGLEPVYYFETTRDGTTTTVTHPADWAGVTRVKIDGIYKYYGPSEKTTQDYWPGIKHDFGKSGWRLPLEAEWEYAARGGKGSDGKMETYDYSGSDTSKVVAWMGDDNAKSGDDGKYYPHEVKGNGLLPNRLGLYDMSGNVVEVCWDWFASSLTFDTGLEGPESGSRVAAPGGAYQYSLTLKSSDRISNNKYDRFNNAGFRIVRTIKE